MTTIQPRIIDNDVVVDFTMPFPQELPGDLLPHWYDLQCMKIVADLTPAKDDSSVGLTITVTSLDDSNRPPANKVIQWLVEQVWKKLTEYRLVTGPMPDIVHLNRLGMIRE